jgi:hypothetical protein
MKTVMAGLAGAAVLALLAGSASAADAARANYFKAGKHQIYVWCTGGAGDASVTVDAANGAEAIAKAAAAKDKSKCWGVWQGLAG